jgi:hypothetical protein
MNTAPVKRREIPKYVVANGHRSSLEDQIAAQLKDAGVPYEYEAEKLPYFIEHKYIPDFRLPNGIYIEGKGWFKPNDRTKLLAVRKANPGIDIRIVFDRSKSKLSKKSKTTYAEWCDKHGFPYADKVIPIEWLSE